MVCLPFCRMMSSRRTCCTAAALSPGRRGSSSTNMAIITSTQPSRMSDKVPSKSNNTWLIPGRGAKPGLNSTRFRKVPVENIARPVESVSLKSLAHSSWQSRRKSATPQRHMNSISSLTTRRAFLRSAVSAGAALAVLPVAAAESASPTPVRKRNIKLGLHNFSVRALGWKAGQLIDYAASLQTDSLFITDLNAFENFEDDYLADLRRKAT